MDSAFFKTLFEYSYHFNEELRKELVNHASEVPEKTIALYCHILNAHHVWNARLSQQKPVLAVWEVYDLEKALHINEDNYYKSLQIVDDIKFDKVLTYKTSKGDEFTNSARDILFHIINHSTHHRGQIVAEFRRTGITPIVTDYIFYKRM